MASRPSSFISHVLRRRYWVPAVALTLLVWLGLALAMRPVRGSGGAYDTYPFGLVTPLENVALDLLFQLRDARRPELRGRGLAEPITIIAVDEPSIRASDVRLQKWPRDWYARLIERARDGGAKVVGLDVYLSEVGGTSEADAAADQALADAIANTENTVLVEKLEAGGTPALKPLAVFEEGANAVGFADFPHDSDQAVRAAQLMRAQPDGSAQFSFAMQLVRLYSGAEPGPEPGDAMRLGERVLPLRPDLNLQLDFRGRAPSFRRVSAADILCAEFKRTSSPDARCDDARQPSDELFRDRIVIIGATNTDAPDLFPTPFYEPKALARLFDRALPEVPAEMPGVELHANAAATILWGRTLARPTLSAQALLVLAALALAALPVFFLRALLAFACVAGVAAALLAVSVWAFNAHDLILPLASAWLGVGVFAPLGFALRDRKSVV
jgi:CHASE2 domain-containing sensor protein